MTVVAGLVQDGNVWMGGDSAAVEGDDLTIARHPKVWKAGGYLFGFCESFRMGQVLEHRLRIGEQKCDDIVEHLVTTVVDKIRETLLKAGVESAAEAPGTLLVGYRGRLFTIESDWAVLEHRYAAIGAGAPYALGCLATSCDRPPDQRLDLALYAADRHCTAVAPPFTVINDQE